MAEGEAGGAPQGRGMSEIQWTVIGVGVALLDEMRSDLGGQIDEMRGSVGSVRSDFGRLGEGAFEEAD